MQYGNEQYGDGAREVEVRRHGGIGKDRIDVGGVAPHGDRVGVAVEDGLAVQDRDGVDIDVDDACIDTELLEDFVHVTRRRDAGPEVEELSDTGFREVGDSSAQKCPVGPRDLGYVRRDLGQPIVVFALRIVTQQAQVFAQ